MLEGLADIEVLQAAPSELLAVTKLMRRTPSRREGHVDARESGFPIELHAVVLTQLEASDLLVACWK